MDTHDTWMTGQTARQEHPGGHAADVDHHAMVGHHTGQGHEGHDKHAGHDPEMFRRRFWLSLVVTIPLVVTSDMVMDWFNYSIDFSGMAWLGPVLGSFVFWWGGWPFLVGGVAEVRDRQPGMMLLISMAITVAYVASMATSLRLARPRVLVGARRAGDDHAARPLAGDEGDRPGPRCAGRAGRAAARRRRTRSRATPSEPVVRRRAAVGDVVLVRAGAPGAGRRRRSSTAPPSSTSR